MQYDEFKDHFNILSDTRQSKKLTYNFVEILFQVVTAMLCGYKTWEEMEVFGEENLAWFRKFSEFENGVPSHDTISRVIGMIEPEEFSLCFTRWCNDIRRDKELETTHVAIDGKALRGTYDYSKNKCLVHMVNAYSVDTGLVLGQIKTEAKSNDITIIPELLKLIRVKGQVISLDAMGCQRAIADDIKSRGGDYLLAVKGNQKTLHEMFLERLPFSVLNGLKCDKHSTEEDNSRGRKMIRNYYVIQFNDEYGDFAVDWKGLESLCVAVTYRKNNKDDAGSLGIRYFISSKKLTAIEFGKLCRGHWGVESMHWWLDAVMKEDNI